MKKLFEHGFRSLIDWAFRRRSPALYFVRAGITLLILVVGGWAADFSIPFQDGSFTFSFNSDGGTPIVITYVSSPVRL